MASKIGINISPNYLLAINHIEDHLKEIILEVQQQSNNISLSEQLNVVKNKVNLLQKSIVDVHRHTIDSESILYKKTYLSKQTEERNKMLIDKLNKVQPNDIESIKDLPVHLNELIKTSKYRKR